MKIVIYGANEIACLIATRLFEDHDIVIIDNETGNSEIFEKLDLEYIQGSASNISVLEAIGIKDADEELETLALHPNPTTGMITLNRTDVQKIEVLDMMGRVVTVCENSNVVNITALTKGYYTLRITTDKGVAVRKVLKE